MLKYLTTLKMYVLSALVIGALLLTYSEQRAEITNPNIMTNYGLVEGGSALSRLGLRYYYFKGIPYAAPPVGQLRFKPPQPPNKWEGKRLAKEHGSICVQRNELFEKNSKTRGSEDCLFLNVYTPELPLKECNSLKPVMVYFHLGGFITGDGNSDIAGPEYFMDKDVVLVTLNYRLSMFGFLTTGDDASPGNYGFKDQLFALKWIQENIENFGGDKNKVTIFGQSAGAASVHHHVLSPASKGLFHAAISQSSTALDVWALPTNGAILLEIATKKLAEYVQCPSNVTTQEIVNCLRTIDAYKLADAVDFFRYFQIEPLNMFLPALEVKTAANPEPFITKTPLEIMRGRSFNNVPWIVGTVEDEGILRVSPLLRNADLRQTLNDNFDVFLPIMFGVTLSVPPEEAEITWSKIMKKFLNNENYINYSNSTWLRGFIDMYSDRVFKYGTYQAALAHILYGHNSVYYYNFNYRGLQSFGDKFALTADNINYTWGVSHCDDLLYLFESPRLFNKLAGTDCDIIEVMTTLWTNFAKYLNPTHENSPIEGLNWPTTSSSNLGTSIKNEHLFYLNITGSYGGEIMLSMNNHYYPDRMQFWKDLNLIESVPEVD